MCVITQDIFQLNILQESLILPSTWEVNTQKPSVTATNCYHAKTKLISTQRIYVGGLAFSKWLQPMGILHKITPLICHFHCSNPLKPKAPSILPLPPEQPVLGLRPSLLVLFILHTLHNSETHNGVILVQDRTGYNQFTIRSPFLHFAKIPQTSKENDCGFVPPPCFGHRL